MAEKITRLPGAKSQESEAANGEEVWDWPGEVDQAAGIMRLVQRQLNRLGDGHIDPEAADFYVWATILGMAQERLRDMLEDKPYRPVPNDLD